MALNETVLFTYLRRAPFGGRLKQDQVDGVKRLVRICGARGVTDLRHVANVLAQVFHETGGRMQPVREAFATSDKQAMSRIESAWKAGRMSWVKTPYWRGGWFGRGDIQITHRDNYVRMGKALDTDLVSNPSRALDPEVSGHIAVVGMRDGLFTGKKLSNYFTPNGGWGLPARKDKNGRVIETAEQRSTREARAIVNRTDKASLIAGYHSSFLGALKAAETSTPMPSDVSKRAAEPDDVKPVESKSFWAIITSVIGAGGFSSLSFLQNLNNVWSLAAFALIVVAVVVLGWLVLRGRITINRSANDAGLDTTAPAVVDAVRGDGADSVVNLSLVGSDLGVIAAPDTGGVDSGRPRATRVRRRKAAGVAKRKGPAKASKRTSGTKKAGGRA